MSAQYLSYQNTGYFSPLMCDYLSKSPKTTPFYHRFPSLENFKKQLEEKTTTFTVEARKGLVKQLYAQYEGFKISEKTQFNIDSLLKENTFTITTGHQLNLFTGPLYFLYKIISVINLSEQLNKEHPNQYFVPVYWMATEDHDFEEINYFNFKGGKVTWNRDNGGAVGAFSTDGLQDVLEVLKNKFGESQNAKELLSLFENAYLKHTHLAGATRYLANELFKQYGLLVVDGNDRELKRAFIPYVEKEINENSSFKQVSKTGQRLVEVRYKEQVHPRVINLFYITQGVRERIVEQEGKFRVNETAIVFTKQALIKELYEYPERFSPNALLRPLYQEVILPNLCYVGGGGELAYWFQLKDYFEEVAVPFPILLLRNSAVLVPVKLTKKIKKLNIHVFDLFKKQQELKTSYTRQLSKIKIDFSKQKAYLQKQFEELYVLAKETDASFLGAVKAQEKKQLKGLLHLEKRLLKAQKIKFKNQLQRLIAIQDEIFPQQNLQERSVNFSEFYLEYGKELIEKLKKNLHPLAENFTVLEL